MKGFSKLTKKEKQILREQERKIYNNREKNENNPHPSEMRYWD